jgi:hypothetical protein
LGGRGELVCMGIASKMLGGNNMGGQGSDPWQQ